MKLDQSVQTQFGRPTSPGQLPLVRLQMNPRPFIEPPEWQQLLHRHLFSIPPANCLRRNKLINVSTSTDGQNPWISELHGLEQRPYFIARGVFTAVQLANYFDESCQKEMRLVSRTLTETKLKAFLRKHLSRDLNAPPWHHTLQHGTGSYDIHCWYGRHLMVLQKQADLWFLQFPSGLHCLITKTDISRFSDHLLSHH